MKRIAIVTDDFSLSYEAAALLGEKKLPFVLLSLRDDVPQDVGAVIMTRDEVNTAKSENLILIDNANFDTGDLRERLEKAVIRAMACIAETRENSPLIIGVDPGERPGIAVLADGKIITTQIASSPEETGAAIGDVIIALNKQRRGRSYSIKIGNGAKTLRNRTINSLLDFLKSKRLKDSSINIQIVDEARTTIDVSDVDSLTLAGQGGGVKNTHYGKNISHIRAAVRIALSNQEGKTIVTTSQYDVSLTSGELKEIQRKSRIESDGEITISRDLAAKVGSGELNIGEAIEKQRSKYYTEQHSKQRVETVRDDKGCRAPKATPQ